MSFLAPIAYLKTDFSKILHFYHTRLQMIEVMNEKDSKNPTFTPFK